MESFFILDSDIFDSIFLVVSFILLTPSIIILDESGTTVVVLSVLTIVEESVVVVEEEPDPQAAKTVTAKTVNNFFIRINLCLIPILGKGNPPRCIIKLVICMLLLSMQLSLLTRK